MKLINNKNVIFYIQMKKLTALLLILALVLAAFCTSALADGEETPAEEGLAYTHAFAAEELAGTTDMNGFVSALALTELNTIVLKEDGTYKYTKLMAYIDENGDLIMLKTTNVTDINFSLAEGDLIFSAYYSGT